MAKSMKANLYRHRQSCPGGRRRELDPPLGLAHVGPRDLDADHSVGRVELLLQLGLEPVVVDVPAESSDEDAAIALDGGSGGGGMVGLLSEGVDSVLRVGLDLLLGESGLGGSKALEVGGDGARREGRGREEAAAVWTGQVS